MCWFWQHKWSKWTFIKTETWKTTDYYEISYLLHTYKATCEHCGDVKFKYVQER